ncbi:MAG: sensor histidine kinase, partial [Novosphingobium sp.]|nr:sensor histidine kinase [Novosphingobium sp.]
MQRAVTPWIEVLLGVTAIAWLTSALLPSLGLASAALLFLLPVLLGATRGGIGPGLLAALAGAGAYNFFLIEPRYTFRVHQPDNLVSVFVLVAVALVTSRLATRLMAREAEALDRAQASDDAAALSAMLATGSPDAGLANAIAHLSGRFGDLRLFDEAALTEVDACLSPLDLSAAAWAIHNGDPTGHGTTIMPASDWTFLPLTPKSRSEGTVAAFARPSDGHIRPAAQVRQLGQLSLLLGQCRDRVALEQERHEREALEERDRLRRTFLASLAHDFRTPLTVIAGRLELLAAQSPEARDALLATQALERMMADLLGAARIESGTLAPVIEQLDLVDAASAAC